MLRLIITLKQTFMYVYHEQTDSKGSKDNCLIVFK